MTDKQVNAAVKQFRFAMHVIDETLPILQAAHLDEVPEITRFIESLAELHELEAQLNARREQLREVLKGCGIDVNAWPPSIGAQVRRMVGW